MDNTCFTFYKSFYDAIEKLPKKEQLKAYKAIMEYVFDDKEPDDNGMVQIVFTIIKPVIDSNIRKRERGKKGGAPKGNKNAVKHKESEEENNLKQPEVVSENNLNQPQVVFEEEKKQPRRNNNNSIKERIKEYTNNPELELEVNNFIDHRKKLKKPMTEHAVDLFLKRLDNLAVNDYEKIDLIKTAIRKGWLDVYQKKESKTQDRNSFLLNMIGESNA